MNLSAVILTRNEEKNIKDCIKSLAFCDEVIVVDDNSQDNTVEIVEVLGAKVYKRALSNDFSAQRNFGLRKATGMWVLFIDADERVTPALRSEIIQLINDPTLSYSGFTFRRHDFIWGKELKHGDMAYGLLKKFLWNVKLLRLAKKSSGKWKRKVHETWDVSGPTRELNSPLLHYPHQTISEFIKDINNFSTLHAKANMEEGKRSSLAKIIIWPTGKFVYNFFLRLGFLDGLHGFIVAMVMSFNSFLAWSKLWLVQRET